MGFFVESLHTATVSSITMFINGSKPLKKPFIVLPPFNFTVKIKTFY